MSGNPSSSGGAGGGIGGGGSGGGPCGACKFLRRKCVAGCIFAPYFDSEQGAAHFAAVHKVFGASNVSKLLLHIPVHKRLDAVVTICYEAQARLRDPVYGCVAQIFALQQQVVNLQTELSYLQAHLTSLDQIPTPSAPPPQPQPPPIPPPQLSIADLPSATTIPATYDLSNLFDPMTQQAAVWALQQQQQQRQLDPRLFTGGGNDRGPPTTAQHLGPHSNSSAGRGHDLHVMARELLRTHDDDRGGGGSMMGHLPCSEPSR